jgi:hypothetical protein
VFYICELYFFSASSLKQQSTGRYGFESCPSKLEEIDAAIHEQQARADSLFQTDERVNTSKDVWMVDKFYH